MCFVFIKKMFKIKIFSLQRYETMIDSVATATSDPVG